MATMTLADEVGKGWREVFRSLIYSLRSYRGGWTKSKSNTIVCAKTAKLKKAIRTISMAAKPGEDYSIVEARVKTEASRYKEFLRNPQPIGKISLNVKHLHSVRADRETSREQYQVNDPSEGQSDPAEGRASVFYRFNRSDDKVLEFIVHDVNDKPLFPIVRTYSSWLGTKEFNLGLERTFYLSMVEDAPGYVTVQAGFMPPITVEKPNGVQEDKEEVHALAARVGGNGGQTHNRFFWFFGRRFDYAIAFECVVVSVICCTIFLGASSFLKAFASTGASAKPTDADTSNNSTQATKPISNQIPQAAGDQRLSGTWPTVEITAGLPATFKSAERGSKNSTAKAPERKRIKRPAALQELSIDDSMFKEVESYWGGLLMSWQKQMQAKLNSLNLSAPRQMSADQKPLRLVVSYERLDEERGHVYLMVYDQEGLLLGGSYEFRFVENEQPQVADTFSNKNPMKLIKELDKPKDQVASASGD